MGDADLLLFAGCVQQPQQQEKRHHRGDEVGVGDFPGAAMVPAMAAFFDFLMTTSA